MLAEEIVKNLAKDGTLVLSGLLKEQENDVLKAYEENGMELESTFPINEWQTLILKRVSN